MDHDVPGIHIDELRQHGDSYYMRLRYGPGFYPTLAAFEAAVPASERHYETGRRMWRVSKQYSHLLPSFFPNFDALTAMPVVELSAPTPPVYHPQAVRTGLMVAGLLAALIAWRAILPVAVPSAGAVASAAVGSLPAPLLRVVRDTPTQLAKMTSAPTTDRPLIRIAPPVDNAALAATLLRARSVRDDHLVAMK